MTSASHDPVHNVPDGVVISSLFSALAKGWYVIVGFAIVGALIAGVLAYLMTPIYRVDVLLAPVDEGNSSQMMLARNLGGLAALAGIGDSAGSQKTTALAILGSRSFTQDFISEMGMLPDLFPDQWDSESEAWSDTGDVPTLNKAYFKFDNDVRRIREDPATGLVTLSIYWHDQDVAARWATELVKKLNVIVRDRAIARSRKSVEFLYQEAEKATVVELRQAIYGLVESQIKEIMLANIRDEFAFRTVDPAIAPDEDAYVRPRKILMVALGAFLGASLAGALILIRQVSRDTQIS